MHGYRRNLDPPTAGVKKKGKNLVPAATKVVQVYSNTFIYHHLYYKTRRMLLKKKKKKTAVSMVHRLHSGRWNLLVFFFSSSFMIYLHNSTGRQLFIHQHYIYQI
jgi:hypothetical protein